MSQLGAIMTQLPSIRFNRIGSLLEDGNGNYSVIEHLPPSFL